jgi:Zn-dependent protease
LGSLFGIPVYVHLTFLLLLGAIGLVQGIRGGIGAALGGVVLVVAIFGSVVLHEFGHALAARRYGIGTRDVTLLPIGGVARLERMPEDSRQELVVALAGPAVNVMIAGLLGIWLFLTGFGPAGGGLSLTAGSFASRLMAINIGLVLFNMLPAFPMDGGRVLRALLAQRLGHVRATELAATIGKGMALLFGVTGLLFNPMLVFIALFVWFGADQEATLARQRADRGWAPPFAGATRDRHDAPWGRPWSDRPTAPRDDTPRLRRRLYRVGPWLLYRDEWVDASDRPFGRQ